MKIVNALAVLVVFLAVACVGMHLYIVETELNEVRQTANQQSGQNELLDAASRAIAFASETQYIAVMAEERAAELAAKLDVASLIVACLEEQLEQATSVVESQCEQLRELIDLNSELQTNSDWQTEEMGRVLEEQAALEEELIDALQVAEDRRMALAEVQERLELTTVQLTEALEQIEILLIQIELERMEHQLELAEKEAEQSDLPPIYINPESFE
jgi:hypothetical protein